MNIESKVIQNILTRRSVRKIKPDLIPDQHIELFLSCLEAAPNAGNLQPWQFYVIKNQEVKDRLCEFSFNQESVRTAPVVIAVSAKPEISAAQYGTCGRELFCIQDTAAAVQNLLLAVHDQGYAAVWIGVVKEKEIAQCLDMPADERPMALIPIGYADEVPAPMTRKGWKTVTKWVA